MNEDDIEEERVRHKELISVVNSLKSLLTELLKKEPSGNGVKESIDKLVALLSNMPKPQAPIITVENKNDEILKGIREFITTHQPAKKVEGKRRFLHKFIRDNAGFIDAIDSQEITDK